MQRFHAPVALLTLITFCASLVAPFNAAAQSAAEARDAPPPSLRETSDIAAPTPDADGTAKADSKLEAPSHADLEREPEVDQEALKAAASRAADAKSEPVKTAALPTGDDKSGVTSKAISVPKGSGSVQGMEESFSAQLSTGIATYSVGFSLPTARGAVDPALGLAYSSSGGHGTAGVGWNVGVAFIARQTDRGIPKYNSSGSFQPDQDRFVFNGGQELTPICDVTSARQCPGAQAGELMPEWSAGWQYYRPRVDGGFMRFFLSADGRTWRVQSKEGTTLELGVALDGQSDAQALERNPEALSEIYRWNLRREYDTYVGAGGQPVNVVYYGYSHDGATAYLSDIFDTSPVDDPTTKSFDRFAHHTRLVWEERSDPTFSYRSGWRMEQNLRLARVDVTSAPYGNEGRELVRRYELSYDPSYHVSLLRSVSLVGRCASQSVKEAGGTLPSALPCTPNRLPPTQFDYSHAGSPTPDGFEQLSNDVRTLINCPPNSVDEQATDLFDVNSDGLPDVLATAPGQYGAGHGVFFNGGWGDLETFSNVELMQLEGVLGATASTLALSNPNLVPLDLDGDGSINLLHMPQVKTYSTYAPVKTATGWKWQGRSVKSATGLDPLIDFTNDGPETQVMDVDFDGLVDVVVSSGSAMRTFFNLGRLPHGDGQFGSGWQTGPTAAALSTDPVETCLPWSSLPVRFSDPDIKSADMNGDGIVDLVRLRQGQIQYWPGRGNGFWGTGDRADCQSGAFGSNRHLTMAQSPTYSDIQGDSMRMEDVNGDGFTDLLQVRSNEVDVWFNVDGRSWTARRIITGTPNSPSFAQRVRLVDVDGSGTRDILWGNGGNYQYVDLLGGTRPWVLTEVRNGLGKTTSLEYTSSIDEMLAAERAGDPWQSKAPMALHLVKRMTETDNLNVYGQGARSYITEYSYRDPVYDGRQREFRGFREATSKSLGDANSPTSVARSTFLLGECLLDDGTACPTSEPWYDNPHEALKGLPVLSETFDENGVYTATTHNQYTLRRLYKGLDGRSVVYAFSNATSSWAYDTANFVPSSSALTNQLTVSAEGSGVGPSIYSSIPIRASAGTARTRGATTVDAFGNQLSGTSFGCVSGCPAGGPDEVLTSVSEPVLLGHPSGWLWRTGTSYTVGSIHSERRGETTTSYTAEGNPDLVTAVLTGTEALQRAHATGATVAPTPGDAVNDTPALYVSETEYDAFGNAVRSYAPVGRCADVFLDPLYAQLATTEMMYPSGCPARRSLTSPPADTLYSAASYDRGLELVTHVIDVSFQLTQVEYDGLGRLTRLFRSEPNGATVGALPAVEIDYDLASDARPYSVIHTRSQDGQTTSSDAYMESYAYVDGMGRTLVGITEADVAGNDEGAWIVGGFVDYDKKGAVRRKYLPKFWDGDPRAFDLTKAPGTPFGRVEYDAFGRDLRLYDLDGTQTLLNVYHALSSDAWDAADWEKGGPHFGTYVTSASDGHGRAALSIERFKENGALIHRETRSTFLPTGEPISITRSSVHGSTTRWLRYDSLGRMVLNVEPNTSENFDPDPNADASQIKAWRYRYNPSGELVGTSDARGCGVNFQYDSVGRLIYEDYSPCEAQHQPYSPASLAGAVPTGAEVFYQYDRVPAVLTTPQVANGSGSSDTFAPYSGGDFLRGKLVVVYDRAKATWTNYDGRSRAFESWLQLAAPGVPSDALSDRYAGRWYRKQVSFDGADRVVSETTGARSAELMGSDGQSHVDVTYSGRGTVQAVTGSYGALVTDIKRTADGLHQHIEYGDLAATRTQFAYDPRRRLSSVQTYRGPPAAWHGPSSSYSHAGGAGETFQKVLQDDQYDYDVVGNPLVIRDLRNPDEWPTGAKPVTRSMRYDDLYRVTQVEYGYSERDDLIVPPMPMPAAPGVGPAGAVTRLTPRISAAQVAPQTPKRPKFLSTKPARSKLTPAGPRPLPPAPAAAKPSTSAARPSIAAPSGIAVVAPDPVSAPLAPSVLAPIGTLHDAVPLYSWTAQGNVTQYELRVQDGAGDVISATVTPVEAGCTGSATVCDATPSAVLNRGSHTVWVRAINDDGAGPWSEPEQFYLVGSATNRDDSWDDPNAGAPDPRRAEPTPYQEFEKRIRYQAWSYDWLGNTAATDDDAKGFYDRSLGDVENGPLAGAAYQMRAASNRSSASPRQGDLRATYDVTGNLTELRLDRDGTCLPSGSCSQIYRYEWDEVGRLVKAKRWDAASLDVGDTAEPGGVADVELQYGYDASDMRVSKRAVDTQGEESYTLYLFNTLELRRTAWTATEQDYHLDEQTEVGYLFANGVRLARLAYEAPGDVPAINGENLHVFFELGDHLGSTSVVLDKATGELVERSTYQAYGGTESDYRPERWKSFREDYRFTGKEEDVEVGLVYFGKRFLNPLLNRWVSADPLGVHGLGADPNLYAYVSGRVLLSIDPLGLESVGPRVRTDASFEDVVAVGVLVKGAWNSLVETASSYTFMDLSEQRASRNAAYFNGGDYSKSDTKVLKGAQSDLSTFKFTGTTAKEQADLDSAETAVTITAAVATLRPDRLLKSGAKLGRRVLSKAQRATRIAKDLEKAAVQIEADLQTLRGPVARQIPEAAAEAKTCFVAGTTVVTSQGMVAIEEVREGDLVLAMPDSGDQAGALSWRRVQVTYERHAKAYDLTLEMGDGSRTQVGVTADHPFWVEHRGWVEASQIQPNERVWSLSRGWLSVRSVHERPQEEPVYNLRVAQDHTYFVSTAAVWVHNANYRPPGKSGARRPPTRGPHAETSDARPSTLQPGPYARESIPAHRGRPTAEEQRQVNNLFERHGCHTCGSPDPGTKSGNAIADHQPPQALGEPTEFFPHCNNCKARQGGEVLQEMRRQKNQ